MNTIRYFTLYNTVMSTYPKNCIVCLCIRSSGGAVERAANGSSCRLLVTRSRWLDRIACAF